MPSKLRCLRTLALLLPLLLLLLPSASALAADTTADTSADSVDTQPVTIPEAMRVQGIPPLSESGFQGLQPFENIRSANLQDWHPSERRLLISTRFAETAQIHEVASPMGARKQLTFFDEPVGGASYRPGAPQQIVFSYNEGGAENFQLYLLDRSTGASRRFTDGEHRYMGQRWSHRGSWLAYVSNARNGRDFDLYVVDPSRAGSERLVVELTGFWFPLDWSPDDQRILLGEYVSANESYLHLVEVASGELTTLTPRKEGETVSYSGGRWSPDGSKVYTSTDASGEFMSLVRIDLESGGQTALAVDVPWDVEGFDLSEDGRVLAFFVNEDGSSRLHLYDLAKGESLPTPEIPSGVARGPSFRPGSHELGFSLSWARSPWDVMTYDVDRGKLEVWTESEVGGLETDRFPEPQLVRFETFDRDDSGSGRTIPAFIYRPDAKRFPGPHPVYINIHGGPEGQARPGFQGSNNYLMTEYGVAMIYPNVRGSAGYGKSYLKLDNGPRREDSVKDIGALLDWIGKQPDLDASRVMVAGGSYGGYMSLATLTHYGDRLRAGFDYVGISNFVTFLENTQEYRRDLRRVEYGDERDPEMRKLLEEISPANHVDRIRVPLLVAQGANDPRVPVTESDQIVAAVKESGQPVWYMVAEDEGHGFSKKRNADYLRMALFDFVRRHLLAPAPQVAQPEPVEKAGRGSSGDR